MILDDLDYVNVQIEDISASPTLLQIKFHNPIILLDNYGYIIDKMDMVPYIFHVAGFENDERVIVMNSYSFNKSMLSTLRNIQANLRIYTPNNLLEFVYKLNRYETLRGYSSDSISHILKKYLEVDNTLYSKILQYMSEYNVKPLQDYFTDDVCRIIETTLNTNHRL